MYEIMRVTKLPFLCNKVFPRPRDEDFLFKI